MGREYRAGLSRREARSETSPQGTCLRPATSRVGHALLGNSAFNGFTDRKGSKPWECKGAIPENRPQRKRAKGAYRFFDPATVDRRVSALSLWGAIGIAGDSSKAALGCSRAVPKCSSSPGT